MTVQTGANGLIYLARGDKVNASLSAAAMIPLARWAATGGKALYKGGKNFTKSSPKLGQQMHKNYKVGAEGLKEFRLLSGRIDFLDIRNGIIHELKPFRERCGREKGNSKII